ncbi:MAG TPA: hypothetical protein PLO62_03250 [Candidatus Hydrogenedentes bacterium]|nr:hypothetical protein [Candidatus Hydrogenedentota bacterium]HOS02213.1 hypothetical protein [Candidatus Hydrogenedentota bacterium]
MRALGMIMMIVGVVAFLITATGFYATIPALAFIGKVPPVVWAIVAVVGIVLWYFTRRPSD